MPSHSITLLSFAATLLLAGCGEGPPPPTPAAARQPGAATPPELLRRFGTALVANDQETLTACIEQETEEGRFFARYVGRNVDYSRRLAAFRGAIAAKFGEDVGGTSLERVDAFGSADRLMKLRELVDTAEIDVDEAGGSATATVPGSPPLRLKLVRRDERWLMAYPGKTLPDPEKTAVMDGVMEALVELCSRGQKALDASDDPEEFTKRLGEISQELLGALPQ